MYTYVAYMYTDKTYVYTYVAYMYTDKTYMYTDVAYMYTDITYMYTDVSYMSMSMGTVKLGRPLTIDYWVFGLRERRSNRRLIFLVNTRTRAELFPLILGIGI